MKKYKVKCVDHVFFDVYVEAETKEEAKEKACDQVAARPIMKRLDVFDICRVDALPREK